MSNFRIFYACQAVGMKPAYQNGETDATPVKPVHGIQVVGINTNFPIDPVFELAMSQVYQNIEDVPEVEVTLEKVFDGYPMLYHLATQSAKETSLQARGKEMCCVSLGIYPDTTEFVSGVSPVEVYMKDSYVGNLSYDFSTDGNFTESITLVGNNKQWFTSGPSGNPVGFTTNPVPTGDFYIGGSGDFPTNLDLTRELDDPAGSESEAAIRFKGGIQRRQYFRMDKSILPQSIFGVKKNSNPGNAYEGSYPSGEPTVYVQSASVSADFGREDIFALGMKGPYYKSSNPSIEVSCDFEVIAVSGDFVSALENGNPDLAMTPYRGDNTREETIRLCLNDGTVFDLGHKNKLQSVSYGGGDAGGGNVSMTYSYQTYNDLKILHRADPAADVAYKNPDKDLVIEILGVDPWDE